MSKVKGILMIYIASDHAGFELKNKIIEHLKKTDVAVEDCGPGRFDPGDVLRNGHTD